MQVSPEGIKLRDEMVFQFARDKNSPLVMLTSGPLSLSTLLSLTMTHSLGTGGYTKSSARVVADSIINLAAKGLVHMGGPSL